MTGSAVTGDSSKMGKKKSLNNAFIIESLRDSGFEPTEKGYESLDKRKKKKRSNELKKLYKGTPTYNPKTGGFEF